MDRAGCFNVFVHPAHRCLSLFCFATSFQAIHRGQKVRDMSVVTVQVPKGNDRTKPGRIFVVAPFGRHSSKLCRQVSPRPGSGATRPRTAARKGSRSSVSPTVSDRPQDAAARRRLLPLDNWPRSTYGGAPVPRVPALLTVRDDIATDKTRCHVFISYVLLARDAAEHIVACFSPACCTRGWKRTRDKLGDLQKQHGTQAPAGGASPTA